MKFLFLQTTQKVYSFKLELIEMARTYDGEGGDFLNSLSSNGTFHPKRCHSILSIRILLAIFEIICEDIPEKFDDKGSKKDSF